jgi:hypothetical protein
MSPGATAQRDGRAGVAAAIDPHRGRLVDDSVAFTLSLLEVAKANSQGSGSFNQTSPQGAAAMRALARWRRDVKQVLKEVKGVPSSAAGKKLAERWLKALIVALDYQRQALSLMDPKLAADASRLGRDGIAESHRLEERLDRVLT